MLSTFIKTEYIIEIKKATVKPLQIIFELRPSENVWSSLKKSLGVINS